VFREPAMAPESPESADSVDVSDAELVAA
jgi:hypothetical protein